MHILLIGYSRIVQKRVLPALLHIPSIRRVDIASHSSASKISLIDKYNGEIFDNYETALSKSKADLVYISTFNSSHAKWVEKALKKGLHVIVDKPAFTSFNDAEKLLDLAQKSGLCLAEATVFAYHPQIQMIRDVFVKTDSIPTRLTVTFSFPPINPVDFRYKKEAGGGALWDTGPYAVSTGRLFFNEEPQEIFCRICNWGGTDGVEISYSMLGTYSEGRSMVGHFGFDTEYRNHLNLLGPGVSIDIDRIFTTPAEMENEIHIKQHNEVSIVKVPKADNFAIFIQKVIDGIQTGNYNDFAKILLSDALTLHRLRLAVHKNLD
jgi:predicted dehydrogenase